MSVLSAPQAHGLESPCLVASAFQPMSVPIGNLSHVPGQYMAENGFDRSEGGFFARGFFPPQ